MAIRPDEVSETVAVGLGCRSYGEIIGLDRKCTIAAVTYAVEPSVAEYIHAKRDDANLKPTVNWAACGSVSPADARRFALAILQAAEAAEAMLPKVIAARDARDAVKAE